MGNINFYEQWLLHALFWLGVVICVFGCLLLIAPGHIMKMNQQVNKWISTDAFFNQLDKPHEQDHWFYKHHRIFGVVVFACTLYILYILAFNLNIEVIAKALPVFDNKHITLWIYQTLNIFLILMNFLIMLISVILIVRPSALKPMEVLFNRWVLTDKHIQNLNQQFEIPENILPGNVRLFGALVFIGGFYIVYLTAGVIY